MGKPEIFRCIHIPFFKNHTSCINYCTYKYYDESLFELLRQLIATRWRCKPQLCHTKAQGRFWTDSLPSTCPWADDTYLWTLGLEGCGIFSWLWCTKQQFALYCHGSKDSNNPNMTSGATWWFGWPLAAHTAYTLKQPWQKCFDSWWSLRVMLYTSYYSKW